MQGYFDVNQDQRNSFAEIAKLVFVEGQRVALSAIYFPLRRDFKIVAPCSMEIFRLFE